MTITFTGPEGVQTYRAIALRSGLLLYIKTGQRPNRAWTPTAMLDAATRITGNPYRRGQMALAVADLAAWIADHGTLGEP